MDILAGIELVDSSSDKFCLQGGRTATVNLGTAQTITLKKVMKNTNYDIQITSKMVSTDDVVLQATLSATAITTSTFHITNSRYSGSGTDTIYTNWMVSGYVP